MLKITLTSEINQKPTVSFFVSLCVILSTAPSVLPMLGNHITSVLFPQPAPFYILRQGLTKFSSHAFNWVWDAVQLALNL